MDDRRKLANGKEIWVIKAGFPNNTSKKNWSDYFFACTLKKYLNRAGVYTVIESRDEWENEGAADVVVALRGPEAYYPDRVTVEEYNAYDLVCIGSAKEEYLEEICRKVQVPVRQLLICADMEIFHPARVEKEKNMTGCLEVIPEELKEKVLFGRWSIISRLRYGEKDGISYCRSTPMQS